MNNKTPVGQLFTHVYQDRGAPAPDNVNFRERLANHLRSNFYDDRSRLCDHLAQETGYVPLQAYLDWSKVLERLKIGQVLNIVTLVWRFFYVQDRGLGTMSGDIQRRKGNNWKLFVSRALVEENVGYRLDGECGVHYLVDGEFEHNRNATIRMLGEARYAAVRAAFDSAHNFLDPAALDTKAAVRSMFEALEIQAKLMVKTQNLNKFCAQNQLRDVAVKSIGRDPVTEKVLDATFQAFGEWINGLHLYRHGQGTAEPVAPPIELAVHILSTGSAYLRLLLEANQVAHSTP
jgi:hypothetical protein